MKDSSIYILLAIPFFFALMGIEWLWASYQKKKVYDLNDTVTNLSIGVGNQVFGLFMKVILIGAYIGVYENFAFFHIENPFFAFVIGTILYDFIFYWAHRWGHEINFFWGAHIVHHQSEHYNLSVALRQSWFHNLLSFWMFLPIPLIGIDPLVFVGVNAFNLLYQFWIHTELVGKLGPLEWFLNTPSAHRVHHSTNPQYLDKNYGGVFIIWDRMFGTYQEEIETPVYGITTPFRSSNPIWANFHFYQEVFQAWKNKTFATKIRILFWDGPSELGKWLNEKIEVNFQKVQKLKLNTKIYVVVQFVLLFLGAVAFMANFDILTEPYKWAFLAIILWTMWSISALLERKNWVNWTEIPRLLTICTLLNVMYYLQFVNWFNLFLIASASATFLILVWWIWHWRNENEIQKIIS